MSPLHASSRSGGPGGRLGGGSPRRPGLRRALVAVPASLALGLALTGCVGGSAEDESPRSSASEERGASPQVRTTLDVRTTVSRVQGGLSRSQRARLEERAGRLLSDYLSAAFLHRRPGNGYAEAFPGFTPGARELALRDVDITADGAYAKARDVQPRGAVAFVSVVAPDGRPAGATARVLMKLDVSEAGGNRVVQLRGRLLLTPADAGWRIFGYDLALDSVPLGGNAQ